MFYTVEVRLTFDLSWMHTLVLLNMGEAKRRKDLGLPPREKKINKDEKKAGFMSNLSAKYPFLPFILGGVLLTVLIVDLLNYYK